MHHSLRSSSCFYIASNGTANTIYTALQNIGPKRISPNSIECLLEICKCTVQFLFVIQSIFTLKVNNKLIISGTILFPTSYQYFTSKFHFVYKTVKNIHINTTSGENLSHTTEKRYGFICVVPRVADRNSETERVIHLYRKILHKKAKILKKSLTPNALENFQVVLYMMHF